MLKLVRAAVLSLSGAAALALIFGLSAAPASAQPMGFATLPPGTLNHTTASAIAKVLKDKGGINMLVQPTAGDQVINPMVGRGEVEIGITNIMEAQDALDGQFKDMRLVAVVHPLRTPMFVRKDSGMLTTADLKGKRVTLGYSAMRNIDKTMRSMLATAGLTEADVKPVLVPNVVRSADEFMAGNADMFSFAFGGPKVKEADATVGGIRALELDAANMAAARKIMPWAYLTDVSPGAIFTGVDKPMKVYSFDNVLIASAKVPEDLVYKVLDLMVKNKDELVAVQPVLREFSAETAYKQYGVPYHPGALKYFKEKNLTAKPID
ncbi:TAXI family TRAP transporter solute-binding subunit [Rhodoplanes sp. Z2-YC6860]|uniref:TAXI family TRAP transporter solute-binding subunit n=1 Tax=Rhodoplanes sp. Z2-YC6860 TaxID=674703 RepID=UPI00078C3F66|nr:TAXI family TRAP transporter solute-binding subunit [Rhodoplanes sp. Z2-YC6860]AMN40883.1 TRAP transporter solute receptor, TAXI family [Rhodoplanes sp. Z2-YC6860]